MTQMSLGFDPPPNPNKMKTEPINRREVSADERDSRTEAVRLLINKYHVACIQADHDKMQAILREVEREAVALNGGNHFAMAIEGGSLPLLRDKLAADDGQVPIHGQPGRFIIKAAGCRVLIETRGILGSFVRGDFSAHAVDFNWSFISPTGFRSFSGGTLSPKQSESVIDLHRRTIESDKDCKLVRMVNVTWRGNERIETKPGPDMNDPAWQPGGWLHLAAANPPALKMGE